MSDIEKEALYKLVDSKLMIIDELLIKIIQEHPRPTSLQQMSTGYNLNGRVLYLIGKIKDINLDSLVFFFPGHKQPLLRKIPGYGNYGYTFYVSAENIEPSQLLLFNSMDLVIISVCIYTLSFKSDIASTINRSKDLPYKIFTLATF